MPLLQVSVCRANPTIADRRPHSTESARCEYSLTILCHIAMATAPTSSHCQWPYGYPPDCIHFVHEKTPAMRPPLVVTLLRCPQTWIVPVKAKAAFHEMDVGSYGGAFLTHLEAAQRDRERGFHLYFRTPHRFDMTHFSMT